MPSGFRIEGASGVTISNCRVIGYDHAIVAKGASGLKVENFSSETSDDAFVLKGSSGSFTNIDSFYHSGIKPQDIVSTLVAGLKKADVTASEIKELEHHLVEFFKNMDDRSRRIDSGHRFLKRASQYASIIQVPISIVAALIA